MSNGDRDGKDAVAERLDPPGIPLRAGAPGFAYGITAGHSCLLKSAVLPAARFAPRRFRRDQKSTNATVRNNCLECDHGKLKRLILPTLGFQSMKTAYAHDRLDVLMFDEILTYLPAKHLDAFVKMNDEKRSRGEIDKFLEGNMPNAEKVFAGALAKFRERYVRIGARRCQG
jgi:hypothetical protein